MEILLNSKNNLKFILFTWTANTMKVGLSWLWKIEVNNNVHRFDINTASEQVSAHKISTCTCAANKHTHKSTLGYLGINTKNKGRVEKSLCSVSNEWLKSQVKHQLILSCLSPLFLSLSPPRVCACVPSASAQEKKKKKKPCFCNNRILLLIYMCVPVQRIQICLLNAFKKIKFFARDLSEARNWNCLFWNRTGNCSSANILYAYYYQAL